MIKAHDLRSSAQIGLDDVAVMCQPVKERRTHPHLAEDVSPFGKCQVGGDQHGRAFIEPAEQVKQKRTPPPD